MLVFTLLSVLCILLALFSPPSFIILHLNLVVYIRPQPKCSNSLMIRISVISQRLHFRFCSCENSRLQNGTVTTYPCPSSATLSRPSFFLAVIPLDVRGPTFSKLQMSYYGRFQIGFIKRILSSSRGLREPLEGRLMSKMGYIISKIVFIYLFIYGHR